ncbi:hypothetical protein T440DRAFT_478109 [Plenodomus tracheiphilus IPT5]|uniref:Uncharacterized protein n=1 Tax=Plenodomus tracheiphilus IPT5 TaxID=1408161 RepID=A0A6A7B9S8_9PLEO|nr:hypothetical protein T440DRAFT_478109 [Plenodomus tracheiphilus IPT5]
MLTAFYIFSSADETSNTIQHASTVSEAAQSSNVAVNTMQNPDKATAAQTAVHVPTTITEWFSCSFLLRSSPSVTWAIGSPADASGPRLTTNAFNPKYGCCATYTSPGGQTSVITDHGFGVQSGPDFPDPMFAQFVGYPRQAYRVDPDGLAANARPTSVASAQWLKKRGDRHEIPMYGDSAVQPSRLSGFDVDAMNNPNALKGTTTREAQPRGNSVVAMASATAPPQPTDPALDRLKGKHKLHQVLKRKHSHGHRRRYVD